MEKSHGTDCSKTSTSCLGNMDTSIMMLCHVGLTQWTQYFHFVCGFQKFDVCRLLSSLCRRVYVQKHSFMLKDQLKTRGNHF